MVSNKNIFYTIPTGNGHYFFTQKCVKTCKTQYKRTRECIVYKNDKIEGVAFILTK